MKAEIKIKFVRINRIKVDKKMLLANPNLVKTTEKTIEKLCDTIKKYLGDYHIEIGINSRIIEDE